MNEPKLFKADGQIFQVTDFQPITLEEVDARIAETTDLLATLQATRDKFVKLSGDTPTDPTPAPAPDPATPVQEPVAPAPTESPATEPTPVDPAADPAAPAIAA